MHDALMMKDSPALSKADREMIVVATSAANDCVYCVVAHGAVLRIRRRDPLIADQVATEPVEEFRMIRAQPAEEGGRIAAG